MNESSVVSSSIIKNIYNIIIISKIFRGCSITGYDANRKFPIVVFKFDSWLSKSSVYKEVLPLCGDLRNNRH